MEALDRFKMLDDHPPAVQRDACIEALEDLDAGLRRALDEGKTERVVELSSARTEIVVRLTQAHKSAPVPRQVALQIVDRHKDLERRVGEHLETKRGDRVTMRQKVVAIKRYMNNRN